MNDLNIENIFSEAKNLLDLLDVSSGNMDEKSFYEKFNNRLKLPFRQPVLLTEKCLYRSRLASSINENESLNDITTYSYIPLDKVSANFPSRGRMNKTGQSMFYASLTPETNYLEIKNDIKEGEAVFISKWKIKNNKALSIFPICLSENVNTEADINKCIAITSEYFTNGIIGEYIRKLCDLFTRTENDIMHRYLASSFLSNYILNQKGIAKDCLGNEYSFQYDGVVYPSARIGNGNIRNSNIVIKPNVVDENTELVYVLKGDLKSDLSSLFVKQIGFNNKGEIKWYILNPLKDLFLTNFRIQSIDGYVYSFSDCLIKDLEGKIVTVSGLNNYLKVSLQSSNLFEILEKEGMNKTFFYEAINNKDDLLGEVELCSILQVDKWTIIVNEEEKYATHIMFDFTLKNALCEL